MTLAALLESRRVALGWSYAGLADRAGYSLNTVRRVCRGENVRHMAVCDVAATLGYAVVLAPVPIPPDPDAPRAAEPAR